MIVDHNLQELRKAASRVIPEDIWAVVETQIEEVGIDNLTGAAAAMVEGIIRRVKGTEYQ